MAKRTNGKTERKGKASPPRPSPPEWLRLGERGVKAKLPTALEEIDQQAKEALESNLPYLQEAGGSEVAAAGRQEMETLRSEFKKPAEPMNVARSEAMLAAMAAFIEHVEEDCRILERGEEVSPERMIRRLELNTAMARFTPSLSLLEEAWAAHTKRPNADTEAQLKYAAGDLLEPANREKLEHFGATMPRFTARISVAGQRFEELDEQRRTAARLAKSIAANITGSSVGSISTVEIETTADGVKVTGIRTRTPRRLPKEEDDLGPGSTWTRKSGTQGKMAPGAAPTRGQGGSEAATMTVAEDHQLATAEAPCIGEFHRQVHQFREDRIERQKPIIANLQKFLDTYAGTRFKVYEQNQELAQTANQLAAEAGCELWYNGEAVTVYCFNRARSKSGDFDVRPLGSSKPLKTQVRFPSLKAVPIALSSTDQKNPN